MKFSFESSDVFLTIHLGMCCQIQLTSCSRYYFENISIKAVASFSVIFTFYFFLSFLHTTLIKISNPLYRGPPKDLLQNQHYLSLKVTVFYFPEVYFFFFLLEYNSLCKMLNFLLLRNSDLMWHFFIVLSSSSENLLNHVPSDQCIYPLPTKVLIIHGKPPLFWQNGRQF